MAKTDEPQLAPKATASSKSSAVRKPRPTHATNAGRALVGHVLMGRYRLESPIGTGATGQVFAAVDLRLNRRVAVKILHAVLAQDASFQRRLRAEARLAASLHHPNIVTVHDWGEDTGSEGPLAGAVFMVLELLEGGSLRSMLDAGHLLSPAQAAGVAADVAGALDYAHRRGIVHRDIKPGNLLFDEHGAVRIADFGLARALAEASWTEPSGTLFATARYASPEQALGTQLDARSDLYSLAIVVTEAVTGSIPFRADTTMGLLSARTQASIEAPEGLGPLAAVVERAGRVDPTERYPDARTMRAACIDAQEVLPRARPLRLVGNTDASDPHPTRAVRRTKAPAAGAAAAAAGVGGPNDANRRAERRAVPVEHREDDDDIEVIESDPVVVSETDDEAVLARVRRSRRWVPGIVALSIVLAIVGAVAAIAPIADGGGAADLGVAVPGVVGRDVRQATTMLERAGFAVAATVATRRTSDPKGTVLDQTPDAGDPSVDGRTVRLRIAAGPAPVGVPSLANATLADASARLRDTGLTVTANAAFDEAVPKGAVISQKPDAGNDVRVGTAVTIVVSKGPALRVIPSYANQDWNSTQAALEALGLVPAYREDFSTSVSEGYVISTAPGTGAEVERGSTVAVSISKGPELMEVPDVRGRLLDRAAEILEANGLVVGNVRGYRRGQPIRFQNPEPGELVPRGTEINLFF